MKETKPLLLPEWAYELKIFEADHPASQLQKMHLLQQAGINIPDNLSFIATDIEENNLNKARNDRYSKSCSIEVLPYKAGSFQKAEQSFFMLRRSFCKNGHIIFHIEEQYCADQIS